MTSETANDMTIVEPDFDTIMAIGLDQAKRNDSELLEDAMADIRNDIKRIHTDSLKGILKSDIDIENAKEEWINAKYLKA